MSKIDFITALARLLRDPTARKAFVRDAAGVAAAFGVREADRAAFERLMPAELEAQARVLVRKRFREVEALLPETCAALGERAWSLFREHAREGWPSSPVADALAFCGWLRGRRERVDVRERHRVRFASGRAGLALNLVPTSQRWTLLELQVLLRRSGQVAEWSLRLGL